MVFIPTAIFSNLEKFDEAVFNLEIEDFISKNDEEILLFKIESTMAELIGSSNNYFLNFFDPLEMSDILRDEYQT